MDEEDRYSASSGESDHDNENENEIDMDNDNDNDGDETMEAVDDGDDGDGDEDNNDEDEEEADNDDNDADNDNTESHDKKDVSNGDEREQDPDADADKDATGTLDDDADATNGDMKEEEDGNGLTDRQREKQKEPTPKPPGPRRPTVRPEALTARLYDIVPTMAAPQATSINAMAITPDLRYWFTGGSDGYIRKYDGPGTINGKLPLTVAQKHPFVDSVTKAGILMSYWENEEPATLGRGEQDHVLSPVYSLAVHSEALWLLSGLESGGINLQSVRHDEGKKIHCLQQHNNAVSVLTLAQDEKSVLSGGWDKNIFDWDLNTGQVKRSFDGSGGQISSIELRPASGVPVPAGADEPPPSTTISTNNGAPPANGVVGNGVGGGGSVTTGMGGQDQSTLFGGGGSGDGNGDGNGDSPAHESLFGGSDAGSLFGEPAGGQPFGHDDDDYNGAMMVSHSNEGGMDHSADMAMAGMDMAKSSDQQDPSTQPAAEDSMDVDSNIAAPTQTENTNTQNQNASTIEATETQQSEVTQEQQQVEEEVIKREDETGPQPPAGATPPKVVLSEDQNGQSGPLDPSQMCPHSFLSATIDGPIRVWDRRVPNPVARIGNRPGVPPWCMSACWSPDGNMIYAGRRNGTVEEFDVRKARRGWEPERVLKFPAGSGAISALKPMVNGRHLVCASHDILRLYDLQDRRAFKHSTVPFLIIPGPPRAGVISSLYIDPTSRFMLSAAGTRGWEGTCTEALIGYEINVTDG